MSNKYFIKLVLISFGGLYCLIAICNYLIDPFNFYNHSFVNITKTQEINQLRLSKAIMADKINPASIILGSSRAEFGYDPDHRYFLQPAYNLSTGGSSMYELTKYLKYAIDQGNLKQVLLIADYINFNSNEQQKVPDFDEYFEDRNLIKYLFSLKTFENSVLTLLGKRQKKLSIYNKNGQREKTHNSRNLRNFGGQLRKVFTQATYFNGFDNNDHYRDTQRSSFQDFEEFLKLCYLNEIDLKIVFGPNHVLHWEAFDYSIGLDKWYNWKKEVIDTTHGIANNSNKTPYEIYDFSLYNPYTLEELPVNKTDEMEMHWELNHYKSELGDMVLDDLTTGDKKLGIKVTQNNMENHILNQKKNREKYIRTEQYRGLVLQQRKKVDLNQFIVKNP